MNSVNAGADRGAPDEVLSYPRLSARTLRFTLGAPRTFTVSPDGDRIAFLRAPSGTDRRTELWTYRVSDGVEQRIAGPTDLLTADDEDLSPAERARRERSRESAAGIVGYATDRELTVAAFSLSSQAWLADLATGEVRRLPTDGAVLDPRPDPTGRHVAYAREGSLRVVEVATGVDRVLAEPDGPAPEHTAWGVAEFIAAEEMDRTRGFWWAPDGSGLLVERYDESPVDVWQIADPSQPATAPNPVRYPAAGTPNAAVSLWYLGLDGSRAPIAWDTERFCYLASVSWTEGGPPLLRVLTRDQRTARTHAVQLPGSFDDPAGDLAGDVPDSPVSPVELTTKVLAEVTDPAWLDILPGVPAWLPDGRLLDIQPGAADPTTRRLTIDGEPVTPAGFQVGAVLGIDAAGVLLSGTAEPTEQHVARLDPDGDLTLLTTTPGVHSGRSSEDGGTVVLWSQGLDHHGLAVEVRTVDERAADTSVGSIGSRQETPPLTPAVRLVRLGEAELRAAVLFPTGHRPGDSGRLPLLLSPYGGPHAQRVRANRAGYLTDQWLADQGFCVVVADGRGTPNRGPAQERRILDDFVSTLDDQVETVHRIAERYPADVDPERVAIRGWSYGGYLSALAVLARPDVFHAAVAGAPVTDWRLYDTCYTERYLGHPEEQPEVYARNSLLDLALTPPSVERPNRPLLLIHGIADDNVVVAHTLRLSSALLAAGRPHRVLPLTGVTHMTPQEVVAENLLRFELDFLRHALNPNSGND